MSLRLGRASLRATATAFLLLVVLLPVASVFHAAFQQGAGAVVASLGSRVARAALWLTLWTAVLVALTNAVLGTLTAWVLCRYRFPGRALLNAIIDLPFAIPTVVTGLMLVVLYGPQQFVGAWLERHGLRVLFAAPGILLSLLFVTFPFVVRAVEPVLLELDRAEEEAAYTLGAWPLLTFRRVILPAILPAILTGALLTFARAVGEFGSVVIVAGNIPMRTLTAPVYVFGAIESGEPHAASAMSALLVVLSFGMMLAVDRFLVRRGAKVST
jgi:sulfate transport system permease protein